jgi:hypothetical protein
MCCAYHPNGSSSCAERRVKCKEAGGASQCSAPLNVGQLGSLIFGKIAASGGEGKEVLLSGGSAQALASSKRVVRA